jgi:hypothetical protein
VHGIETASHIVMNLGANVASKHVDIAVHGSKAGVERIANERQTIVQWLRRVPRGRLSANGRGRPVIHLPLGWIPH